MAELFNPKLATVEGIDAEKHIGAWAEIDDQNMTMLKGKLSGVEDDGFHMVSRAFVLDVPEEKVIGDWEAKNKGVLEKIKEAARMVREKGQVKVFPAKVGTEEHPSIVLFFSVRQGGETDNVLVLSFTYCYGGLIKPKEWGNKRDIPPYPTVGEHSILRTPLLQEVI